MKLNKQIQKVEIIKVDPLNNFIPKIIPDPANQIRSEMDTSAK